MIQKDDLCARCNHPASWHRHDDADPTSPTDPACKFRCIGYDCERPGPPVKNGCDCPDFVEQQVDRDPPHSHGCICADCSGAELTADND